jgi:hypothetical protein
VTDAVTSFDWGAESVDTGDLGLALDALTLGLGRTDGLRHLLSRNVHHVRVGDPSAQAFQRLRSACGSLSGTVPSTTLPWAEALTLNLDRRGGRWWLLVVPEIWTPRGGAKTADGFALQTAAETEAIKEFIRERRATRYNSKFNAIIDAWVRILCSGVDSREIRTWNLHDGEGIDPWFEVSGRTAYSRQLVDRAAVVGAAQ